MSDIGSAFSTYTKQVNQAADTQTADLKKAADVENKSYTEYKSFLDKHMDDFNNLEKEGAETFKPFKAPQAEDPLKSYGATMAGLMGIASFFTHSSMVGAMDAATASINAARQGNTEAYNQAFTEWKNNNEIMQKKLAWETDAWSTIGKMAETDYNAALGHAQALSSQTKDATATAMIRAGMFDKLLDVKKTQADMGRAADEHSQAMIEQGEKLTQLNIYKDWAKANPNATAQEKSAMLNQTMGRYASSASSLDAQSKDRIYQSMKAAKEKQLGRPLKPDEDLAIYKEVNTKGSGISGNESVKLQDRVDQFDSSLDKIDEASAVLDRNILAAGIGGRARRLGESVSNVMGSNETDLVQFRRNIEYIQTLAHRLLTDSSGRPLSGDARRIDDIVGGLSLGDTTANTKRALDEIKRLYTDQRQRTISQLHGSWTPGTSTGTTTSGSTGGTQSTPQPAAKPWENDPVATGAR